MARLVASRGTCIRRQVGCVLVDGYNRVLSTGYNGVACDQPHCIDVPCPGSLEKSGSGLDICEAIHAEINALLWCRDITQATVAYVTVTPCISCIKALLAAPNLRLIVASEEYPHKESRALWVEAGRGWKVITDPTSAAQRFKGMRQAARFVQP